MKKKYGWPIVVVKNGYIEVEAESIFDAYSIFTEMGPDEIELLGNLDAVQVYSPTLLEKMNRAELQKKQNELKINELERRILLNEIELLGRDYDPVNEEYWDSVYEEIEILQAEIDEIRRKGSC